MIVLVDSSVWIEHFRRGEPRLQELLSDALVLMHPFVLGELPCGTMKNRSAVLGYLDALPKAVIAIHEETFSLIDGQKLWGRGIGWVDAHLIASAFLSKCRFWTLDERLKEACNETGLPMYLASSPLTSKSKRER